MVGAAFTTCERLVEVEELLHLLADCVAKDAEMGWVPTASDEIASEAVVLAPVKVAVPMLVPLSLNCTVPALGLPLEHVVSWSTSPWQ